MLKFELTTVELDTFTNFEMHPCAEFLDRNGFKFIEQVDKSEAEFWSVYVRLKIGGLQFIADFSSENEATAFLNLCRKLVTSYEPLE